MRFFRQSLWGMFLAAVSIGLLVYAAQSVSSAFQERMNATTRAKTAKERAFAVNVITAVSSTQQPVLETFGEIQSLRRLELRASSSGRVVEISEDFVDGGEVAAGQILLRIDPTNAEAALERAMANLEDAKAQLRDAARTLDLAQDELKAAQEQTQLRQNALKRQQDLKKRGVGTAAAVEAAELSLSSAQQAGLSRRQSLTQAQAKLDQSKSGLKRNEIAFDEAKRALDDTTMTAPFSGLISAPKGVLGGLVNMNERLSDLIDPSQLEVSFRLSTAQYARMLSETGTLLQAKVHVSLQSAGTKLEQQGQITRVSAALGQGETGRLVFAKLETAVDNRGRLKAGDFVTVRIQEPALSNAIRLPTLAMDAKQTVLALGDQNRLEEIPVTLLRRQGDDILVEAPNLNGREVVMVRSPLLGAGILVKPLGANASASQEKPMIELSAQQRAKLIEFVQSNAKMAQNTKDSILQQLKNPQVPTALVARLEARMKG